MIYGLSETWLSEHIYNNETFPSTFAIYCKDQSFHSGGVLLAVNMNIPSRTLLIPEDIEVTVVEVLFIKPFRICVVYNPPNNGLDYQHRLLSFMSTLLLLI